MNRDDASLLLEQLGVLRSCCDLDLLVFFARHPRALLSSETLAAFLGYGIGEIAGSLDILLVAGLLARQQTPAHAARFYVFAPGHEDPDGSLSRLVRVAGTREGRLALRAALAERRSTSPGSDAEASHRRGEAPPRPRRIESESLTEGSAVERRRTGTG